MHEQTHLIELCILHYATQIIFVGTAENRPVKVAPLRIQAVVAASHLASKKGLASNVRGFAGGRFFALHSLQSFCRVGVVCKTATQIVEQIVFRIISYPLVDVNEYREANKKPCAMDTLQAGYPTSGIARQRRSDFRCIHVKDYLRVRILRDAKPTKVARFIRKFCRCDMPRLMIS